ncbi:hypothetical protein [Flagellimonas sp.]|uniref:hypothetical protein n=1 Tax=Flagellimonas sp. TaxID=2058762 RepID=UPI003BB0E882
MKGFFSTPKHAHHSGWISKTIWAVAILGGWSILLRLSTEKNSVVRKMYFFCNGLGTKSRTLKCDFKSKKMKIVCLSPLNKFLQADPSRFTKT